MKARIKSTGVLVDVTPQLNINPQHSNDYLYVCDNMVLHIHTHLLFHVATFVQRIEWDDYNTILANSYLFGTQIALSDYRLL